ncbi:MAG: type 4a pilus biogenesis protein PilO [Elusimicrobia bacterium]|nr:type 4a pilus biogenesis protein PilO [Elusimicrobiota bacterium]
MDLSINLQRIEGWKHVIQEKIQIFQEKGLRPFAAHISSIFLVVLLVRMLFYIPSMEGLARAKSALESAKAGSKFASDYENLRSRFADYTQRLVPYKEKDSWMFNSLLSIAKQEGIILESITPQTEVDAAHFIVAHMTLEAKLPYYHVGRWIKHIENSSILLMIENVNIEKMIEPVGMNKVQLKINTLISKAAI